MLLIIKTGKLNFDSLNSSQLYHRAVGNLIKIFTLVNYDSRVVPDWKIPHITTLGRVVIYDRIYFYKIGHRSFVFENRHCSLFDPYLTK